MKHSSLLIALSLTVCTLTGCRLNNNGPTDNGQAPAATASTVGATGNYATPVVPDPNQPRVQLLLSSPYWVAEYWVNHADNAQNEPNRGRWWSLRTDGTFLTGQWDQTLAEGSWVVYYDGKSDLLHLDAEDDRLDMEFQLQAVSNEEDYMSWVGTSLYGMSRIAVKAIKLGSMPTKAQFGVQ